MKNLKSKKSAKRSSKKRVNKDKLIDEIMDKVHHIVQTYDYTMSDAEDCEYEELQWMLWELAR